MTKRQLLFRVAMPLLMVALLNAAATAQQQGRGRGGMMMGRGSLAGLLRMEQVQTEMKLTAEQKTKVQEVVTKLMEGMREPYSAAREIEDRTKRMAKYEELSDQADDKLREQLRDMNLQREQIMRLYQIRMQLRPVVDSLANEYVARQLELKDEQKKKLAEVAKEAETKRSEMFSAMRNAGESERGSFFQKFRQLSTQMDEKALAVLTDEQKKSFESMKGEKFELQMQGGRGRTT